MINIIGLIVFYSDVLGGTYYIFPRMWGSCAPVNLRIYACAWREFHNILAQTST